MFFSFDPRHSREETAILFYASQILPSTLRSVLLIILAWAGTAAAGSFDFALENAYRRDSLDWNIAGDTSGQNPNILSELTWDDLEIYQLSAEGNYHFGQQPDQKVAGFLKGRAGYGWIYAGRNQDSDYAADNRTDEFSRSNNNADDGHVVDFLAGGGARFTWRQGRLSLTPLAGLSYHRQKLTITDGYQTVSSIGTPLLGPISGLSSVYTAEWYGPWLGADFSWRITPHWEFGTDLEMHAVQYDGIGNWNLRNDLQQPRSFKHKGSGAGVVVALKGIYRYNKKTLIALQGRLEDWRVEDGEHTVFRADGSYAQSRLNEVNHNAASLGLQLIWPF